jgi:hypothetical protein
MASLVNDVIVLKVFRDYTENVPDFDVFPADCVATSSSSSDNSDITCSEETALIWVRCFEVVIHLWGGNSKYSELGTKYELSENIINFWVLEQNRKKKCFFLFYSMGVEHASWFGWMGNSTPWLCKI